MAQNRDKTHHLLVIRTSAMGDVAMTVPVIRALRASDPGLRITVLTKASLRPFFRDIPSLEFIEVDFAGADKGFRGLMKVARKARTCGADAVADLHDVLRSKYIVFYLRLWGRRVSVIDKGRSEKRALTRKFRKFFVQLKPTVRRYYETIRKLGFNFPYPEPEPRVVRPIPEVMIRLAGEKTGTWVGVAPFARHQGKIYPIALMDRVIQLLSERHQKVFIFGGGVHERDFAKCMEERYQNVVSVIGRLALGEEMDLMSNLDVVLTMDSATLHIASIVGAKVVSIWGATHPYAGFMGFGQDPESAIGADLPCRPCSVYGNKPCFMGDHPCMSSIGPERVVAAVEAALK